MKKISLLLLGSTFLLSGCSFFGPRTSSTSFVPFTTDTSRPEPEPNLHFEIKFYTEDEFEPVKVKTINDTKLVFNNDLFSGIDTTYWDNRYNANFKFWADRNYKVQIPDNYVIDLADYDFDPVYDSMYRKDGKFDEYVYLNYRRDERRVSLELRPVYNTDKKYYNVTFQNPDGSILGYDKVPMYDYEETGYVPHATYTGDTPRIFDQENPLKFVGWDKDLNNIIKDTVFTAIYEEDEDTDRDVEKILKDQFFDYSTGGFITSITNTSGKRRELLLRRNDRLIRTQTLENNATIFFELKDGINRVEIRVKETSTIYDAIIIETNHLFSSGTILGNRYGNYSSASSNMVIDGYYTYYEETTTGYVQKSAVRTDADIYLELGQKVLLLDGIEKCIFRINNTKSYDGSIESLKDTICVNKTLQTANICLYDSDREIQTKHFGYEYQGAYYLGNELNHYLVGYEGYATNFPGNAYCLNNVVLSFSEERTQKLNVVIPASIKYLKTYANANYVRFEDFSKINNLRLDEAYLDSLSFIKDNEYIFNDCFIDKVIIPADFNIQEPKNDIFSGTRVTKIEVSEPTDSSITNPLYIDDECLCKIISNKKTLLFVPWPKMKLITKINAQVSVIGENALDEGSFYVRYNSPGNVRIVELNTSITHVYHQRLGSMIYVTNRNPSNIQFDENYYCNGVYGIFSEENHIYEDNGNIYVCKDGGAVLVETRQNPTGNENIVIPDFITVGGVQYPVTEIGGNSFRNCSIASIKFPAQLKKTSGCAFECAIFSCDITFPDTFEEMGGFYIASSSKTITIRSPYGPYSNLSLKSLCTYEQKNNVVVCAPNKDSIISPYNVEGKDAIGLVDANLSFIVNNKVVLPSEIVEANIDGYFKGDIGTLNYMFSNLKNIYCSIDVNEEHPNEDYNRAFQVGFNMKRDYYDDQFDIKVHVNYLCDINEYVDYLKGFKVSRTIDHVTYIGSFISSYENEILTFSENGSYMIDVMATNRGMKLEDLTEISVSLNGVNTKIPVAFQEF